MGTQFQLLTRTIRHCKVLGTVASLLLVVCLDGVAENSGSAVTRGKHPVTVADIVAMTSVGDPEYWHGGMGVIEHFSPDGKKIVVVTRRGILSDNTNEYSILRWSAEGLRKAVRPTEILRMRSSSNRPAVEQITWLKDNQTICFLGERFGEHHQLFCFNMKTRRLKQVTNHWTNVVSYSLSLPSGTVAYVAESEVEPYYDAKANHNGLIVTTQSLYSLLENQKIGISGHQELFLRHIRSSGRPKLLDRIPSYSAQPYLSPNGRYIVMAMQVDEIPEDWKKYTAPDIDMAVKENLQPGQFTALKSYRLIDTQSGAITVLINAPISFRQSEVKWSPDSRSVALSNVYLPLMGKKSADLAVYQKTAFLVKVSIPTPVIDVLSQDDLKLLAWDRNEVIRAEPRNQRSRTHKEIQFHRSGAKWQQVDIAPLTKSPVIAVQESMTEPPKLVVRDGITQESQPLMDLNPQLEHIELGKVEEIRWMPSDGREAKGGLYYPIGYERGKRYPLVIQTHGWRTDRFWIDGPWPSAFAAQPLAARGIMVLQAEEDFANDVNTPKEIERQNAIYEGAIEDLDKRGLIDPEHVGIIGFSRTCLFVKYALTHSKFHYAAAAVQDGFDGGYFQYLVVANVAPKYFFDGLYGAPPFGAGLRVWSTRAPGFNIDRVSTPLRIIAVRPTGALAEWEWFAGLTRLEKPVELVIIPDGVHILEKPWDRMISQQGNVDWFRFWLTGQRDPSPEKIEQYRRWSTMAHEQAPFKTAHANPN